VKNVQLPSDAVLVLIARANEKGPQVDVHVSEEWWAGASKDHRKALFMGALESLGRVGAQVIPEEFTDQKLDPPELPEDVR
jgi:hypothetical protein